MSTFDGKVALVTGAARGQGRAHALALAAQGASLFLTDIGAQIGSVPYDLGSEADLTETQALVAAAGAKCETAVADVRSRAEMRAAVAAATEAFGSVDIALCNAGICSWHPFLALDEAMWQDVIDVNLTGVANTLQAVLPGMIERKYGRVVVTGSTLGRQGMANVSHYSAAKWGLHGLVKSIAMEVATEGITINLVNPTIVNTPMMDNAAAYKLFCPDIENPTRDDALPRYATLNRIPMAWMEPEEISKAMLFLASDDARYITGTALDVAAGANTTFTA
jgi:SDR family mycofactocin-dependent oxidoreductase